MTLFYKLFCVSFHFFWIFLNACERAKRSVKLKAQQKGFGIRTPLSSCFHFFLFDVSSFFVVMCTHSFFLSVVFRSMVVFALFCVRRFSERQTSGWLYYSDCATQKFVFCFRYENQISFFRLSGLCDS